MEKIMVKREINKTKTTIKNKNGQVVYDMYEITITYNTGETKKVKTFTAPDAIDINDDRQAYAIASLTRLKKLMNEQEREDYIFLGMLEKASDGRYKPKRDYMINGKVAQLEFDRVYPQIKVAYDNQQKQSMSAQGKMQANGQVQNQFGGKHYAISDIHGMYGSYMEVIRKLKPNDHLYILGDAVDRGKNGIKIILDIMQRQGKDGKKPEITYMIGNHDASLINFIEALKKYNLTTEDINDFIVEYDLNRYLSGMNLTIGDYQRSGKQVPSQLIQSQKNYKKQQEDISKKIEGIRKLKGISESEIKTIMTWLIGNNGLDTANAYGNLPKDKQDAVYEFLVNSYVFLTKQIGNKRVMMTHAAPPHIISQDKTPDDLMVNMTFKQMQEKYGYMETIGFLEDRHGETNHKFENWKDKGFITICGHDPIDPVNGKVKIEEKPQQGLVRIDTACGHKKSYSKLAVYCIEDGKAEFYIDEKEEDNRGIIPGDTDGDGR